MKTQALYSQNLSKYYRVGGKQQIKALDDVSITVERGEIVALLGLNGAGKTTFVKLMLGLARPSMGVGYVLGSIMGATKVRRKIGYLPELHQYPPFLHAASCLRIFGEMYGMESNLLTKRIEETIELVGLQEYGKLKIQKYSKGMRQRLGIARCILNNPDLILLDEPTEGLDPIARKEIRELLIHLRNEGKTIFLNSHILSEVEQICNRAIILKKGKIIASGTLEEIIGESRGFKILYTGTLSEKEIPESINHSYTAHQLELFSPKLEELNQVIDILRANTCMIQSIQKVQSNLEEQFISLVK